MDTVDLYLNIIRLIVEFVLLVVGILLLVGKSYLKKKGENLATKEDIAEITRKVEEVKNDLKHGYKVKESVYEDSKDATIKAYEALQVWHKEVDRMQWKEAPEFGYDELKMLVEHIDKLSEGFTAAFSKVGLFLGRGPIYEALNAAARHLSDLQGSANSYLYMSINFKQTIEDYEERRDFFIMNKQLEELAGVESALIVKRQNMKVRKDEAVEAMKKHNASFIVADEHLRLEINKLIADPTYLDK